MVLRPPEPTATLGHNPAHHRVHYPIPHTTVKAIAPGLPGSPSQRPQDPAPLKSGQTPAPGPLGPESCPLTPGPLRPCSQKPWDLSPPTSELALVPEHLGSSFTHQRDGTSPRTSLTHQCADTSPTACQGRAQPTHQQAVTSPRSPWALLSPTSRPIPALVHTGSISKLPKDLVPPTSRPT